MQKRHNGHAAGGPAADLAEAERDIDQNQHTGCGDRHQALDKEGVADGGVHIADRGLLKGVVRELAVQVCQQVVQLLGGQRLAARQRDGHGLVARNVGAALHRGVGHGQRTLDLRLDRVQVCVALVAQRDHSAAAELDVHRNAEHRREHKHHRHQHTADGVEKLAAAHKVDLGGFPDLGGVFLAAVQPGVAQRLEAGRTADHQAGGADAEHKVEHHAGQQRVAEGVDGAVGGGAEPGKDGREHAGPEPVGGAEGAHQDGGHDDDGHVAVNDRGQAHVEAAGNGAVQAFALAQLLADALGNDDVGVNAHADAQDDAGDAGQRQRGAGEHGKAAGDHRQRGGDLTQQRDDRQRARQAVAGDHHNGDQHKGQHAGQDHDVQAAGAQRGADGGEAAGGQRKGQRAGVDLVGQRFHFLQGKIALDDGVAVHDGLVDGGGADVLVIQPDADDAALLRQAGGRIGKIGRAVAGKGQGHRVIAALVVGGGSGLHLVAGQNLRAVGGAALAKDHLGGGADLVNGLLGVKVRLVAAPGEADDDLVVVVVDVAFVVRNAKADQTLVDDGLGRVQLFVGGVDLLRRDKGDADAAADVDAEPDVRHALDIGGLDITILIADAKQRRHGKHQDQNCHDDKMPWPAFSVHTYLQNFARARRGQLSYIGAYPPPVLRRPAPPGQSRGSVCSGRDGAGHARKAPRVRYSASASSFSTTASRTQTVSSSDACSTSLRLG